MKKEETKFDYSNYEMDWIFGHVGDAISNIAGHKRDPKLVVQALRAINAADAVIIMRPRVTGKEDKVFHLDSNYANASEALEAGHYDRQNVTKDVPIVIKAVNCSVRAVPLGEIISVKLVDYLFPAIVDPITALTFGAKLPDEQRLATYITPWRDYSGQFWDLILTRVGTKRIVDIVKASPDDELNENFKVLVYV